ncbi:fungal-specific transcription factor domain-containing protein, partial [Terfezia claveryi]
MSSSISPVSTSHSILGPQLPSSTTPSISVRTGTERVPIAAIGHTRRRASGVGEAAAQKESMNCKSCRKKKIKCNRMRPSCDTCLAFQCECIYDAIPRKRGPKTEVLEELLKRVSGLEKRLAEGKEANITKKLEDMKASNGGIPPTESTMDEEQPPESTLAGSHDNVLNSIQFPDSYIDAFFGEFHGKPYEVLHEETFRASLAQGAIHPSQLHIVCAIGVKYVHTGPRGHSLCVNFTEAARAAVDMDFPSLENFQTLLLISISYFYLGKGYKTFMLLGTAVRMAYGLDLNRELPPDEPATPVEREIRRRAFWACYLLDRFAVCGSRRPPMLLEESILLKLPGSVPQMMGLDEQFFSSRMSLTGSARVSDLLALRRQTGNASALCIDITKLLGTTARYIEQGGVKGDIHLPWHAQSNLTRIRRELDNWAARKLTCELYSQTPGAAQGDGLYLRHPDVTLLVMAKAIFHLVSCLIYRPFLALELITAHGPEAGHGGQQHIWQAEATKMCFIHANAIGDLVEVLKSTKPEGFQWPAILGYCVVTAATVHLHGAYYQNTERDPLIRTSKGYFDQEMQQIRDFRDKWPAARVQYVMLKRLKQAHEELIQRL